MAAAARASRRKRVFDAGLAASSGFMTFSATRRPSGCLPLPSQCHPPAPESSARGTCRCGPVRRRLCGARNRCNSFRSSSTMAGRRQYPSSVWADGRGGRLASCFGVVAPVRQCGLGTDRFHQVSSPKSGQPFATAAAASTCPQGAACSRGSLPKSSCWSNSSFPQRFVLHCLLYQSLQFLAQSRQTRPWPDRRVDG